jgi:hypothetical protein
MNISNDLTNNNLESEGTDTGVSPNKYRNTNFFKKLQIMALFICFCSQTVNASQIHLFSDENGLIVGTLVSDIAAPLVFEGFIENKVLEAIEVQTSIFNDNGHANLDELGSIEENKANSDGTGVSANSDGTGFNANSDGTGETNANSDGTGDTEANSDGTGKKLISIILDCETETTYSAMIESTSKIEVVMLDAVYLNNKIYGCK